MKIVTTPSRRLERVLADTHAGEIFQYDYQYYMRASDELSAPLTGAVVNLGSGKISFLPQYTTVAMLDGELRVHDI